MADIEWLSEDWAGQVAAMTAGLPPVPGVTGTVSVAVSTGRRREVGFHWGYQDGAAQAGSPGVDAGADLAFTISGADAADVVAGEVEPSVSFMRGRLKASGDGALLIGFLASTTSPEFDAWRQRVAGLAAPVPTGG